MGSGLCSARAAAIGSDAALDSCWLDECSNAGQEDNGG